VGSISGRDLHIANTVVKSDMIETSRSSNGSPGSGTLTQFARTSRPVGSTTWPFRREEIGLNAHQVPGECTVPHRRHSYWRWQKRWAGGDALGIVSGIVGADSDGKNVRVVLPEKWSACHRERNREYPVKLCSRQHAPHDEPNMKGCSWPRPLLIAAELQQLRLAAGWRIDPKEEADPAGTTSPADGSMPTIG